MDELPNGFTGFAHKNNNYHSTSDVASSDVPFGASSVSKENLNYQYSREQAQRKASEHLSFNEEDLAGILEKDRRWAWVEVDRSALQYNVLQTKRLLKQPTRLMAVVKADGYGHGALETAKTALSAGASYLGVATVDEGIELRQAGLKAPILVLSEPPKEAAPLLLHYYLMPAVYTPDFAIAYAETADLHGRKAPYHLAINTGMNRIGVRSEDALEFLRQIDFHRALQLEGCFTHFATADSPETLDFQIQINRFVEAMRSLEMAGINPGIVHCDNSAAIYRFPKTHFDMVRLGIALYGYQPACDTARFIDLKPAMSVKARITNVVSVPMSEGVSYGMNYRSPGSVKICTVPLGYADGLMRLLSGQIDFAYQNQPVHQVGNICMDQCMFEVNLRPSPLRPLLNPQIGDEVLIAGPHADVDSSVETMAKRAATIPYEIVVGFSHRLPRYYA